MDTHIVNSNNMDIDSHGFKRDDSSSPSHNIPPFLARFHSMVGRPEFKEMLEWSITGDSVWIPNPNLLMTNVTKIIPSATYPSFFRQCSHYQFSKLPGLVTTYGTGKVAPKSSHPPSQITLYHPCFQRDRPDLLVYIIPDKNARITRVGTPPQRPKRSITSTPRSAGQDGDEMTTFEHSSSSYTNTSPFQATMGGNATSLANTRTLTAPRSQVSNMYTGLIGNNMNRHTPSSSSIITTNTVLPATSNYSLFLPQTMIPLPMQFHSTRGDESKRDLYKGYQSSTRPPMSFGGWNSYSIAATPSMLGMNFTHITGMPSNNHPSLLPAFEGTLSHVPSTIKTTSATKSRSKKRKMTHPTIPMQEEHPTMPYDTACSSIESDAGLHKLLVTGTKSLRSESTVVPVERRSTPYPLPIPLPLPLPDIPPHPPTLQHPIQPPFPIPPGLNELPPSPSHGSANFFDGYHIRFCTGAMGATAVASFIAAASSACGSAPLVGEHLWDRSHSTLLPSRHTISVDASMNGGLTASHGGGVTVNHDELYINTPAWEGLSLECVQQNEPHNMRYRYVSSSSNRNE